MTWKDTFNKMGNADNSFPLGCGIIAIESAVLFVIMLAIAIWGTK